jgi:hypothetical protein
VVGSLADRHAIATVIDGSALGRNADVRLLVSLVVMTASSVCFVLGAIRLVQWIWSKVTPNQD